MGSKAAGWGRRCVPTPAAPLTRPRYGSVLAQLNQLPVEQRRGADISMLAEQGFVACSTEGQVMAVVLSASLSPGAVNVALLGVRAQIKRELATIAADPVRYINKR